MPNDDPIRVLLIDDEEAAFELTRALMGKIPWADFELDFVTTVEAGREAIARDEHDVYLVDYLIGADSGIDLVREARAEGNRMPMILLTGKGRWEVDVEAMEAGVSDYLDKSKVDPDLMERSIRYAVERHRVEQALRESEARHRSMFDHLPIGLYRITVDGELLEANPALVQLLGSPDRESLQHEYARNYFVSPGHRQAFIDRLDQFGVVRGFESELTRGDGQVVHVRNAARAHRGPSGEFEYVEGTVEDVTEEWEARDLFTRAARFGWVFEGSGLPMVILDLAGNVRDANPAFLRAFGYELDDLRGHDLAELAAEGDRDDVARIIKSVASGLTEMGEGERRMLAADGTVLWTRTRAGLVRSAQGHPDHMMILMEDVAEA